MLVFTRNRTYFPRIQPGNRVGPLHLWAPSFSYLFPRPCSRITQVITTFQSVSISCSVMSDSLQPQGLEPTRLLCPWDSPSKNTGVGCQLHISSFAFLPSTARGIFAKSGYVRKQNQNLFHCLRHKLMD